MLEARMLTAGDLRARILRATDASDEHDGGDHVLNAGWAPGAQRLPAGRDAAVLVPVVDRPAGASVLLTTRSRTLRHHSGQIAFPGGRIDPTDASPEAAALREAAEEVGLPAAQVEILGRLEAYRSSTGYRIVPVLSVVTPPIALRLNPDEVDDAFEVPLGFLMDAANHRLESRVWQGAERHFYTMPFGERYIWGVTAGILRSLYERYYA